MTTSKVPTLPTYSRLAQHQHNHLPHCTLKWRQGQLLVSLEQQVEHPYLPSFENEQWLVKCLSHSPVRLLRIDPALGEANLNCWANASEQANKAVFLRLPTAYNRKRCSDWWLKRLIEWSAAALLLLVLSPVILALASLLRVQSPEPIFSRQWCVGERGKLFRLVKFRTSIMNAYSIEHQMMGNQKSLQKPEDENSITLLGRWMRKYKLDELPQLFNVLRGEMSLRGSRPWTLYDAVRLDTQE